MEAEAGLVLPDISIVDSPQPPPGSNFPRPDFSEIISDDVNDSSADKNEGPLVKPTFKSALQAKKAPASVFDQPTGFAAVVAFHQKTETQCGTRRENRRNVGGRQENNQKR
jgi:hypothetical protein